MQLIAPSPRNPADSQQRTRRRIRRTGPLWDTVPRRPNARTSESMRITLDRYRPIRPLGAGGCGRVELAQERATGKRVAVKILSPERAREERAVQQFQREAGIAQWIDDEHVVRVLEPVAQDHGRWFYVMEYCPGETLGDRLDSRGALPVGEAVDITIALCEALAVVHANYVVHQDVKPDNILLPRRPRNGVRLKLMDFGIAIILDEGNVLPSSYILGTPIYMPPEQIQGEAVDGRADMYATGAILYEMLAGRVPFISGDAGELMALHLNELPPAFATVRSDLAIPSTLEAIVMRALAKDPTDRFRTVEEMRAALETVLARPIDRRAY